MHGIPKGEVSIAAYVLSFSTVAPSYNDSLLHSSPWRHVDFRRKPCMNQRDYVFRSCIWPHFCLHDTVLPVPPTRMIR